MILNELDDYRGLAQHSAAWWRWY